jgi:hypothetical protein
MSIKPTAIETAAAGSGTRIIAQAADPGVPKIAAHT